MGAHAELLKLIRRVADPAAAVHMSSYFKHVVKFHGVKSKGLKALLR
jgi:hypothetical protein